jgi:hypothetical protein
MIVSTYQDSPPTRAALVRYLQRSGDISAAQGSWAGRLQHWWDQNPWRELHDFRGWAAGEPAQLCGYAGAIPVAYAWQGQRVPALVATTLRAETHTAALKFLLNLRQLAKQTPILCTTPLPKLARVFQKMGGQQPGQSARSFYATGRLGRLLHPQLPHSAAPAGLSWCSDIHQVKGLARPYQNPDQLEKWVTPESLRWQLATPTRQQAFLGLVDAAGVLHAYLLLSPLPVRAAVSTWEVLEAFCSLPNPQLILHTLLSHILRQPQLLPARPHLICATTFPGAERWLGTPLRRAWRPNHTCLRPAALQDARWHCQMAEGDYVL